MKLTHSHERTPAEVRRRLEDYLPKFLKRYEGRITDAEHLWEGDAMTFSFKALAMRFGGVVTVTEQAVAVDMGLPFMARPFEPEIKARIMANLDELLA